MSTTPRRHALEVTIDRATAGFAAVLFDMDGTLVDTEPLWHLAEIELMAGYGAQWTPADQAISLGGPMDRVSQYMSDTIRRAGYGDVGPDEIIARLLVVFERHLDASEIVVYDGADVLLREAMASELPLALVSNSTRRLMDKVLSAHPDYRFDFTIAGDEVTAGKPHPGPYLDAARELGVPISECLIVEDSPTGVAAAREAGGYVVAVAHTGQLDPGPRGLVVDRLDGYTLAELGRLLLP